MKGRSMSLSDKELVMSKLSDAALYEQLAEECVELAHACQKKARKLRDENPTPLSVIDIDASLVEEFTDVVIVCDMLPSVHVDNKLYHDKVVRWSKRLH